MKAPSPDDFPRRRRFPALAAAGGLLAVLALATAFATGLLRSLPVPPAPQPLAAALEELSGPAAAVAARAPAPPEALPAPSSASRR